MLKYLARNQRVEAVWFGQLKSKLRLMQDICIEGHRVNIVSSKLSRLLAESFSEFNSIESLYLLFMQ